MGKGRNMYWAGEVEPQCKGLSLSCRELCSFLNYLEFGKVCWTVIHLVYMSQIWAVLGREYKYEGKGLKCKCKPWRGTQLQAVSWPHWQHLGNASFCVMVLDGTTQKPLLLLSSLYFNKHVLCQITSICLSRFTLCLSPPCSLPRETDLYGLHQQAPMLSDSHLGSSNRTLAEDQRKEGTCDQGPCFPGSISVRSPWIGCLLQLKVNGSYSRSSHRSFFSSRS